MGKWRLRSGEGAEGSEIVSLIGEGTCFTGDLVLVGGARIDGRVVGHITAHALLVVGPSGDIDAQELRANCMTVCGNVRGKIHIEDRLEIQAGGRVSGQLTMEREGLVIAPGGLFEGVVDYAPAIEDDEAASQTFALEATV